MRVHLDQRAYHGLIGEYVRLVAPHSEADEAALLLTALAMAGNAIGDGPYVPIEADRHTPRLYVLLVGESARARKGVSRGRGEQLLRHADPEWADERILEGMSTGEGLLEQLRQRDGDEDDDRDELPDATIDDGRLLVVEPEYARVLRVIRRESNTLSAVLRSLWDRGSGGVLTRGAPIRVRGAHLSVLGHITVDELRRELDDTDVYGGLLNRHLVALVHRSSRRLPRGGSLAEHDLQDLGGRLERAITVASARGQVGWTPTGLRAWETAYMGVLDVERPGLLGAATARAEAQTLRLAITYALLDGASAIDGQHVTAALAVWRYCEQSAVVIFGEKTGDKIADRALEAIRVGGEEGIRRNQLREPGLPAERVGRATRRSNGDPAGQHLVTELHERTDGRTATRYVASEYAEDAEDAEDPELDTASSAFSAYGVNAALTHGDWQGWAERLLDDHADVAAGEPNIPTS